VIKLFYHPNLGSGKVLWALKMTMTCILAQTSIRLSVEKAVASY